MARKEKRFEKIHSESLSMMDKIEIFRDTHTGVCYIWRAGGYAGGLSVLLGTDGKPVIQL